tara:strand:- start:108 stop:266 length:159 start_codon:yes stop_codon:yes gene_type:complete
MKKPVYQIEELVLMDKKFLAEIICRQESEINNLSEEIKAIMKEWKSTINLLK